MGKIKIIEVKEAPIPEVDFERGEYEKDGTYQTKMILFSDNYMAAENSYRVYVAPEAVKQIFDHISWGKNSRENCVEQGGFLIGRRMADQEKELNIIVVEQAVPASGAKGSSGTLYMTAEDMREMHRYLDRLNEGRAPENRLIKAGWFHTHPNSLDVYMSGTDRNTQKTLFSEDQSLSIVLNPHRKIWKCYRAEDCYDTKAEMLIDQVMIDEYGKNRLTNNSVKIGG